MLKPDSTASFRVALPTRDLRGLSLWTVGRLSNEPDIFRKRQIVGHMPASLIDLHDHKVLLIGLGHMLQEEIHHLCIGGRQNERRHFAFRWCHSGIHVGIFTHQLTGSVGPHSWRSPGTPGDTDAAKAAFIFGHLQHRSLIGFPLVCLAPPGRLAGSFFPPERRRELDSWCSLKERRRINSAAGERAWSDEPDPRVPKRRTRSG